MQQRNISLLLFVLTVSSFMSFLTLFHEKHQSVPTNNLATNQLNSRMNQHQYSRIEDTDRCELLLWKYHELQSRHEYTEQLIQSFNEHPEHFAFVKYLPHLKSNPKAIIPSVFVGRNKTGATFVFGIPTILRPKGFFLNQTLKSLLNNLNTTERTDCLFMILITDEKQEDIEKQLRYLLHEFGREIQDGLIEVLVPSKGLYPDFGKLPKTHNDKPERIKFRSKQVLDYAYLMTHARTRGTFYIQLEDDILTVPNYYNHIKKAVLQKGKWILLQLSNLGFIGKLFKTCELYKFIDFLVMFYSRQPVDWLMSLYLSNEVCSLGRGEKKCRQEKEKIGPLITPSIFQHMGEFSSFKGAKNPLKDKNFPGYKKSEKKPTPKR